MPDLGVLNLSWLVVQASAWGSTTEAPFPLYRLSKAKISLKKDAQSYLGREKYNSPSLYYTSEWF